MEDNMELDFSPGSGGKGTDGYNGGGGGGGGVLVNGKGPIRPPGLGDEECGEGYGAGGGGFFSSAQTGYDGVIILDLI